MKLRKNQIKPVEIGIEFFKQKKSVPSIIVAPTAFGKSIVIAHIAKGVNEKILVIQPSKELLEQNYNKFINLGGEAKIYSASMGEKEIGNVTYATIGSIISVTNKFIEYGITKVIIDECDRFPREPNGMLRRFLKGANISHVLGLTATPLKLQSNLGPDKKPFSKLVMLTSKSGKGNFFKDIIYVAQIDEMVKNKFWAQLHYMSYDFHSGDLVYNTTGADFTMDSMKKAYKNQNISKKIIKKVNELYDRKAILVAVPSINEAKELSEKIPYSAAVYSDMPSDERKQIINDFKKGIIHTVIQVNILSIGFDYPELDCVIIGRPTASLSWYYQFIGRVTRIHPDKKNALIIDFVGAVTTFGKVEDLYFKQINNRWQLYGEDKKLLTGIDLKKIGYYIEGKPTPEDFAYNNKSVRMTFGKYAGKDIKEIPESYRNWLLKNIHWTNYNKSIKNELLRLKKIGF